MVCYFCVGLRLMQQNMAALAEIKERQEKLMGDALQLQQDMLDFRYSMYFYHNMNNFQTVLDHKRSLSLEYCRSTYVRCYKFKLFSRH